MSASSIDFHQDEIDTQELLVMLLVQFGQATELVHRGYRFQRQGSDNFLDVSLSEKGEVNDIRVSRGFPESELLEIRAKIENDLIDNQSSGMGQKVLFSRSEVIGYFRYRDLFQILPVPDAAPRPRQAWANHPFLLQYAYVSCPNHPVNTLRMGREATLYGRLLGALSGGRIAAQAKTAGFTWVLPLATATQASEFRQEGYEYPGLSGRVESFTTIAGYGPIERTPPGEYYSKPHAFVGQPLALPEDLEVSLDLAHALNNQEREKFMRACTWYGIAGATWRDSDSSAFIALVTALESLMEQPEHCASCGQTITKGLEKCGRCRQPRYRVTRKFTEFLDRYVPFIKQVPQERKLLYQVRSTLAHGLELLLRDLEPLIMMHHGEQDQLRLQMTLYSIASTAIYSWLQAHNKIST